MTRNTEFIKNTDKMIGLKINNLRVAKGLSRSSLASKIGVTHQQVQKYEKGQNRISLGRLAIIAEELGQTPGYFFGHTIERIPKRHERMGLEVSRNFSRIKDQNQRKAINELIKNLAPEVK